MRQAELTSLINELCSDVRNAASKGDKYWQLQPNADDIAILEFEIFGLSHRIGATIDFLAQDFSWIFRPYLEDDLFNFREALTGGTFQVTGRLPEPQRFARIEQAATLLTISLRRSRRSLVKGVV